MHGPVITTNYNSGVVDVHSIIATENDLKDPLFENFAVNEVALTEYVYDEGWDFHVKSGSPVLAGANSGTDANLVPYFSTNGLFVNGVIYHSPAVKAQFGAFGLK